ncbi:MAG: 1,2-epoxyphenylacetyl-CoA isomerase [Phycisphaerae bacterium]|nr:1,2-epoxyphenylacetyl-CoA isomerase [Phycisphaerae bacterium]
MSQTFSTVLTGVENGVLTITLNRPESLNAYNETMSVELAAALKAAERDDAIRCVVLTGAGRAFCSGQDLQEVRGRYAADSQGPIDFGAHLRSKYAPIVTRLRTLEKPVVAAVNGVAAGAGASFAFAADLRIAAAGASFVMAFVHVGLVPDSAATVTLQRLVGFGKAAELCFLGEKVPADEALRIGLVNRVVPDEALPAATRELAARLAAMPTRAIGLTKRALNRAWTADLGDQLEYEAFVQQTAGQTADHREGVMAFIEKRKPRFQGK